MISIGLLLWALSSPIGAATTDPISPVSPVKIDANVNLQKITQSFNQFVFALTHPSQYTQVPANPIDDIKEMLYKEIPSLSMDVIKPTLTIIQCTQSNHKLQNNILSIIDYSKPSNEKRLWIFSIKDKQLLFHTYVSHGIKSGTLLSQNFSNVNNSKASSIGVYQTEQTYYGRDGLSLRFTGMDYGFNSNAANRYIVMHGGWYVSEDFIKRYGRPGRSWGCPAVSEDLKTAIINTIKDNTLFIAYYPDDKWMAKSRFLHCDHPAVANAEHNNKPSMEIFRPNFQEIEDREEVLFATVSGAKGREKNEAILVMPADSYARIFQTTPPLSRMLRRQIANKEYIAISRDEFKSMATPGALLKNMGNATALSPQGSQAWLNELYFVIPVIKNVRGYYETQMHIVNTGRIVQVSTGNEYASLSGYNVKTDSNRQLTLWGSKQFIRWLGL